MKILDPGHIFELSHIDGVNKSILTFVKREGTKYPGNCGHFEGINLQELFRSIISRLHYLNAQRFSSHNLTIISACRLSLIELEIRAAHEHGLHEKDINQLDVENIPVCIICGHWICKGHT